jgi:3D (Asp-Asp-Asp) domain-containing protein
VTSAQLRASHTLGSTLLLGACALLLAAPVSAEEILPDPAPAEPSHVVSGTGFAGLALREGPGRDYARLGLLPDGATVRALEGPISDGGVDWYKLEVQGIGTLSGYGNGAYLVPGPQVSPLEPALPVPGPQASAEGPALPAPPGSRTFAAFVAGYADGPAGGSLGSITASGTRTHWGAVAADTRLFPFGTKLLIEGFDDVVFVVEDMGGAVRGLVFDIWFPEVATAVDFGLQRRQVTVLPPGS